MTEDRAPITAAEAAQLAQRAQQLQAERARDVIQPALEHAYAEIRCAARSENGLTMVDVSFKDFGLTAEQLLALSRALERQGFKVQSGPNFYKFSVGWQPAPVPRGAQLLREGLQEVSLNE